MSTQQTKVTHRQHPIQVVSRRTGLTTDVIRAWERRYSAIKPSRASNRRRLYNDDDVEKLILLRRATSVGRRIGDVARLSIKELHKLVDTDASAVTQLPISAIQQRPSTGSVMEHFDDCLDAITRLNNEDLHFSLNEATTSLGVLFLLEDLLRPLLAHVRDECRRGALRDAHYSIAMHTIRGFLTNLIIKEPMLETDYKIVCASPTGQIHDLSALRLAVAAKSYGWQVISLGIDSTINEIVYAQNQTRAQLIVIGITRPTDDPLLANQLRILREHLDDQIEIAITGSGAAAYFDILQEIRANYIQTISELPLLLDRIMQIYRVN